MAVGWEGVLISSVGNKPKPAEQGLAHLPHSEGTRHVVTGVAAPVPEQVSRLEECLLRAEAVPSGFLSFQSNTLVNDKLSF